MKCNTPVIGKIPRMVPEWMGSVDENGNLNLNDNGVWTANLNSIPDVVATMVGLYLEDALPENILNGMKEYQDKYTVETSEEVLTEVYERLFGRRTVELESMVTKLQEQETAVTEK
jgi:hypothetical protein